MKIKRIHGRPIKGLWMLGLCRAFAVSVIAGLIFFLSVEAFWNDTAFAELKSNTKNKMLDKQSGQNVQSAELRLLEPSLVQLEWREVSTGDLHPQRQPLFDLRKLLALAQPVQMNAQQGPQDLGGYLYNPESYISVDPRLLRLVNRHRLQLFPELRLRAFFGLLHAHTFASDGIGDARDAFRMARDLAGLDFFALTEHSEYWSETAQEDWLRQQRLAREESRPDFLAWTGFEYSHPMQGHMVVLNSGQWTNALRSPSLNRFYDWLASPEQSGALAIFAHPGFHTYRNWFDLQHFAFDQRIERAVVGVEVIQRNVWRRSLKGYQGQQSHLDEALQAGWWLGPMASQDNHTPYWGVSDHSRIAVLMNELKPSALIDALSKRRFYATQSPQLQLVAGLYDGAALKAIIGDVLERRSLTAAHATLRLRLLEPNPLWRPQRIEVIVNGKTERSLFFLDQPSQVHPASESHERTSSIPWWERLLNNGVLTRKPFEWSLNIRSEESPDIFEVDVPVVFPDCTTVRTAAKPAAWSFVFRFYQGERGQYLTTTSPIRVRCS
jgi:hypothetical protein